MNNPFAVSWKKKLMKVSNSVTFSGLNPLTIRVAGTGEYVKRECEHLVDLFDLAEFDHLQDLKRDSQYE
jgi:hypothetical protein